PAAAGGANRRCRRGLPGGAGAGGSRPADPGGEIGAGPRELGHDPERASPTPQARRCTRSRAGGRAQTARSERPRLGPLYPPRPDHRGPRRRGANRRRAHTGGPLQAPPERVLTAAPGPRACPECLRRAWLVGSLSGHIETAVSDTAGRRAPEVLSLPDDDL